MVGWWLGGVEQSKAVVGGRAGRGPARDVRRRSTLKLPVRVQLDKRVVACCAALRCISVACAGWIPVYSIVGASAMGGWGLRY